MTILPDHQPANAADLIESMRPLQAIAGAHLIASLQPDLGLHRPLARALTAFQVLIIEAQIAERQLRGTNDGGRLAAAIAAVLP